MRVMAWSAVVAMLAVLIPAAAQDIAGVEDCTKTQGLDRRTGCLQSNVNFLQRTMNRNALEAHRRLLAADAEIAALKAALAELRKEVEQLRVEKKTQPKLEPKKK
jgi:uncharacterized protein YecT (DUF1311 family)